MTPLFFALTLFVTTPFDQTALMKQVDYDAVNVARCVNDYMAGTASGNKKQIRNAFLPNAGLQFVRDGKPMRFTLNKYVGGFKEGVANDRRGRMVASDITGNAAMVKLEIHTPTRLFTDYLVLLKVGDDWKIAEKICFVATK